MAGWYMMNPRIKILRTRLRKRLRCGKPHKDGHRSLLSNPTFFLFIFVVSGIFQYPLSDPPRWASAFENPTADMPQQASESTLNTCLGQIDMHWGGRLKAIGSATFARNNSVFEPVGTGTYLNLDTDLRINNDTFLADWGHLETQYEAILEGGKAREKRRALSDIFPHFEGSSLFVGAPLKDDRRLIHLTHTIT